jgi:prefoldin alpha subunit
MADDKTSQQDLQEMLAQLQYLQNVYTQRYDILNEQIATYNIAKEAVLRNIEMIDRSGSMDNKTILLNADGGVYIEAGIKKLDKMITYVGASYLVEKPLAEAKDFLQSTLKGGDAAVSKLIDEKRKVEKELFDISYKLAAIRQG